MKKLYFRIFSFVLSAPFFFIMFSCKSLPYIEKEFLENEGAPVPLESRPESDNVNGKFPKKIYIKTLTQTFGKEYEFLLDDGKIWYKKIGTGDIGTDNPAADNPAADNSRVAIDNRENKNNGWQLYLGTGLPFSPKNKFPPVKEIVEIASDADCLYAFSDEGKLYRSYLKQITSYPPFEWVDYFGWPKKIQLYQNSSVADKISWSVGSSRKDVEYYEDACENKHNYGPLGVESITFLVAGGKALRYSDPACPSDFSHSFSFPKDENFVATNISESASTIFLIDENGTMYTRLVDYNTVGSDPMLYEYTYEPYTSDFDGSEEESNVTPWFLPNESWKKQPSVKNAKSLTKYITIIQTGKGNNERELRVAGVNQNGKVGYFYKKINETEWNFCEAPLIFADMNSADASKQDGGYKLDSSVDGDFKKADSENSLGKSQTKFEVLTERQTGFKGNLWKNGEKLEKVSCAIDKFDFSEGPVLLYVSSENFSEQLQIYYSEVWTQFFRLMPGTSYEPLRYFGTLKNDFDQNDSLLDNDSLRDFSQLMQIHNFYIQACLSYVSVQFDLNDDKYEFYLTTDGNMYYSPKADRNLRFFLENSEKIDKHSLKIAKKKARKSSNMKTGIKFAKFTAKTLFLDKTVDKIGIIVQYSDEISSKNAEFYQNQYELIKFVLKSSRPRK